MSVFCRRYSFLEEENGARPRLPQLSLACFYFLGNRWQGVTAVDTGDAGVADGKQTWSNDQDPECGKSVETGVGNMSLW